MTDLVQNIKGRAANELDWENMEYEIQSNSGGKLCNLISIKNEKKNRVTKKSTTISRGMDENGTKTNSLYFFISSYFSIIVEAQSYDPKST